MVHDFYAGGADAEITVRADEVAFAGIGLAPRVTIGRPVLWGPAVGGADGVSGVVQAPHAVGRDLLGLPATVPGC